jgi:L-fuconolactonase
VVRYGWIRGKSAIEGPHGLAELDEARGAVEVQGIVWIEVGADPGQHHDEAAWVAGLAAREPRIKAVVAHAPIERGAAAAAEIERLLEHGRLKGIRRLLQDEPDAAFCLRPAFIEGVRLLARHDLSFDICVYHPQLGAVLELVRRCPEVRFVLDHIGKPGIGDGLMTPWRTQIEDLAALPNVWCKLSGLITEAHTNWTREQLRPYIDHVIERFGFARVMFGSDWPVSEQTHRYEEWVEVVDRALRGASADERRRLFCDNAVAFYRLDGS